MADNGTSCQGCGDQEEFYGCADIAITQTEVSTRSAESTPVSSSTEFFSTSEIVTNFDWSSDFTSTTQATLLSSTVHDDSTSVSWRQCWSTQNFAGDMNIDIWCDLSCNQIPPFCPPSMCECGSSASTTPVLTVQPATSSSPSPQSTLSSTPPTIPTSSAIPPTTSSGSYRRCVSTGAYAGRTDIDKWCELNCNHIPSFCPGSHCKCDVIIPTTHVPGPCSPGDYEETGNLKNVPFASSYCNLRCSIGDCPPDICNCSSGGSRPINHLNCYATDSFLRALNLPGMNAYCKVVCDERWCPSECTCDKPI